MTSESVSKAFDAEREPAAKRAKIDADEPATNGKGKGNKGKGKLSRKERKLQNQATRDVPRDRFGFPTDYDRQMPALNEVKVKVKAWGNNSNTQTKVNFGDDGGEGGKTLGEVVTDKVCPLYSTYTYAQQLKMKGTYARTIAKKFTKDIQKIC